MAPAVTISGIFKNREKFGNKPYLFGLPALASTAAETAKLQARTEGEKKTAKLDN